MKLYNLNKRLINKNYSKYRIDWDKKERSKFQTTVKQFLKPFLQFHIVYSEFPVVGTLLRIDMYDATTKTAYEICGEQHRKFIPFFAGSPSGYLSQIKRDLKKIDFCELNEIKMIEIYPEDLPLLSRSFFKEKFNISL